MLEFLTLLYHKGLSYSSINSAKSALASFVVIEGEFSLSNSPDVTRFMRGIFNLRTPKPKYSVTWDVNVVLEQLRLWFPHENLTLKELTLKTVTMVALTSGLRAQSIHDMDLDCMSCTADYFLFTFTKPAKQEKAGKRRNSLKLFKFQEGSLDVHSLISCYIGKTAELRNSRKFWISFRKPHVSVGRQTISRWLKSVLNKCGIDTTTFSPHSTRMASTSKACSVGVGLTGILKTAGWANAKNFHKFYLRGQAEEPEEDSRTFSEGVLLDFKN